MEGKTVDFILTKKRNKLAAHKFLLKAIANNGCPKVINIDRVERTRKRSEPTIKGA
jgi:putative transposase